jgi:hypothetical protein
MKEALFIYIAE